MTLDPQFGHQLESKNAQSMEELFAWIEGLSYLSQENKNWAKTDATKRESEVEELSDLQDKYDLYNQLGEIRAEIIQNVPGKKQEALHKFIDEEIINPSSGDTHGREMKRERLQQVLSTVRLFRSQQTDLQLIVRRTLTTSDVDLHVLAILNAELYKNLEKTFDDAFWSVSRQLSPQLFPYFTDSFDFSLRKNFTLEQSPESLKSFPALIKKGVLQDAAHITSTFFHPKEAAKQQKILANISEKKPAELLKALFSLQKMHSEQQIKAQKQTHQVQKKYLAQDFDKVQSLLDVLKKQFGPNIIQDLNLTKLEANLELHLVYESQQVKKEALKKRQESRAQEEREKIETEETKEVEQEEEKEKSPEEKTERKLETSLEKETKMKFLERCIEHAQRILEMCEKLGIPKDDPKYWGEEGCKNRVQWLEDNGFYNTYKTFNASDRNMPKQERVKGVRFRWLDAQRGSNLSFSRAHEGLKYLQRYKESGYELATLAGGLSCDWGTNGPNYRTPDKFILLVTEELNKVRGVSRNVPAMAA